MQDDNKIDRKQFLTLSLAVAGGAILGCASGDSGGGTGGAGKGGAGAGGGAGTNGGAGRSGGAGAGGGAGVNGTAGASGNAGASGTAGAGGNAGSGGVAANCGTSLKVTITQNHGHVLAITVAEITADQSKTYSTKGAADARPHHPDHGRRLHGAGLGQGAAQAVVQRGSRARVHHQLPRHRRRRRPERRRLLRRSDHAEQPHLRREHDPHLPRHALPDELSRAPVA